MLGLFSPPHNPGLGWDVTPSYYDIRLIPRPQTVNGLELIGGRYEVQKWGAVCYTGEDKELDWQATLVFLPGTPAGHTLGRPVCLFCLMGVSCPRWGPDYLLPLSVLLSLSFCCQVLQFSSYTSAFSPLLQVCLCGCWTEKKPFWVEQRIRRM